MSTFIHFRQTALLLLLFSVSSIFAAPSPVVTNLTPPNYSVNFTDVCFRDQLNGFMLTQEGLLFHSKDGGKNWEVQQKLDTMPLNEMVFVTPDTAIIVANKRIFRSIDSGKTWQNVQNIPLTGDQGTFYGAITNIGFVDHKMGFATGNGIIWKTADGGGTWKEVHFFSDPVMGMTHSFHFIDSKHGYAFAYDGNYFETTDGGESWTNRKYPDKDLITTTYFIDALNGFCNASNIIKHTVDGGKTWTQWSSQTTGNFSKMVLDKNIGFIAVSQSALWISTDTGKTWKAKSLGADVTGLSIVSDKTVLVSGVSGQINFSNDAGKTWDYQLWGAAGGTYSKVWFTDSLHGHALLTDGMLLNTTDGGVSWERVIAKKGEEIDLLRFASRDTGYAVSSAHLFRSYDGGKTWDSTKNNTPVGSPDNIQAITNNVVYYGTDFFGTLFYSKDAGKTSNYLEAYDLNIDGLIGKISVVDPQHIYIFCTLGQVTKTTDGGINWSRVDIPDNQATTYGHFYNKEVGVAVTRSTIYRSENGGNTWTSVFAGKCNEYVSVDSSTGIVTITGRKDSVYITHDQGKTWAMTSKAVAWGDICFVNQYLAYCTTGKNLFRIDYPRPTAGTIQITAVSDSSTLHITAIHGNSFGLQLSASDTLHKNNRFTVLLSDASGSFTAAQVIGQKDTTASCKINCTVPANLPSGNYKIKVSSSNPALEYTLPVSLIVILQTPPQPTISTASLSANTATVTPTAGSSLTVNYTVSTDFKAGNTFTAYLSDATGSFTTAVKLGESAAVGSGSINCTIPANTVSGTAYQVKLVSSNPAAEYVIATTLSITLQIPPQPTISTASLSAYTATVTPTTSSSLMVNYTVSADFKAGNIFTAYLSDATGSFTTAVKLGENAAIGSGSINCTIPANTASGTAYQVKLVASNPAAEYVIATALNVTLQTPPACAIHITKLEPAGLQVNSTSGDTVVVYYTLSEGCAQGETPSAQLSDATGDFTNGRLLTDISTTTGTARLLIPAGVSAGAAYRVTLQMDKATVVSPAFSIEQLTALTTTASETIWVRAQPRGIMVHAAIGSSIYLSDILGHSISTTTTAEEWYSALPQGWYAVLVDGRLFRVFVP